MPKRIVFTGPESTGKTYLSQKSASHFHAYYVPEYARNYLDSLGRSYLLSDIKNIEKGQLLSEKAAVQSRKKLIIQDTDFLTILIWYRYKYKLSPDRVRKYWQNNLPDLYLLCYPDFPWVEDHQRENPLDRSEIFEFYKSEIEVLQVPYYILLGGRKQKMKSALSEISAALGQVN